MKRLVLVMAAASLLFASCGRSEESSVSTANRRETSAESQPPKPCINLNTATSEELMTLPGIGEVMARKVIEYREQAGPFRRAQDIIIIDGFSERKYRAIAGQICV